MVGVRAWWRQRWVCVVRAAQSSGSMNPRHLTTARVPHSSPALRPWVATHALAHTEGVTGVGCTGKGVKGGV